MNKKVTTAPCEACGGLLPLKPILTRRRQRQRKQDDLNIDAHHPEQGSTNECESEQGVPLSDSETEEQSSGKMRSYDSVLEGIQAIFANQKVKRETISPYMHRAHRPHRDRKSDKPTRHERSLQAHQHAITQRTSKSRSPADGHSPCFLHPHQGHEPPCRSSIVDKPLCKRPIAGPSDEPSCKGSNFAGPNYEPSCKRSIADPTDEPSCKRSIADEPTCKRVLGRLPQNDASNCSFDPLRISPSPRIYAAHSSTHHLGEGQAQSSSPNCKLRHGAPDTATCRPASEPPNTQPRMENLDCYLKCHIHHIDEHVTATLITSPRRSQSPQQQILYSCHQQTVVQHHEGCHIHPESPPRNSCPRCGCPERDSYKEVYLPEPAERHHSPKSEQEVIACAQRLSPGCKMLSTLQSADVCGLCCHPKKDHKKQDQDAIHGCHLHGQIPSPKCQKPAKCNDPLVWAPRRVRKPSSVHWLDRLVTSQKFPPHVVQQFLQGKRKFPPRVKKPKCAACMAKSLKVSSRDPCLEPWNETSVDDITTVECKKQQRGKLSRLALSRSLIIKPVVKLSTVQGPWTTRMEFQVCSECRNPLVATKSGRWKSILEEMSSDMHGKKCYTKRVSCQTIHGLVLPSDAGAKAFDLRCPELFSTFRLHSKIQKLQNETFDRCAAMQEGNNEDDIPGSCRWHLHGFHGTMPSSWSPWDVIFMVQGRKPSRDAIFKGLPEFVASVQCHSTLMIELSFTDIQRSSYDFTGVCIIKWGLLFVQLNFFIEQVAETEGIELDKELFDQLLPEIKKPVKRRSSKGNPRNYVSRQQRREVYRDLCKIVDPPPMPVSPVQCPQRDVGVQVGNTGRPPADFSTWNPSDFGAEPCLHLDRTAQSSLRLCTPIPTYRPEQEQLKICQEPDKSWNEEHWAYLVEVCKQTRMEQGVYGSCAACQ